MPLSSQRESRSEVPAFVCDHVFTTAKPILFVSHEDGDWQFLCGGVHAEDETPRVVGSNHLLERDPTLLEVLALPFGWIAEREAVGGDWTRETARPPVAEACLSPHPVGRHGVLAGDDLEAAKRRSR